MATNLQFMQVLSERTALTSTESPEKWASFLRSAAFNYKYDFHEQVEIYAQRPDATACAPIELWNRLGFWVNRGSKGIALLNYSAGRPRLRYVFDVSNTNNRQGLRAPIWNMQEHLEAPVTETLSNAFGELDEAQFFPAALMQTAKNIVEDNYQDYYHTLYDVIEGSLLEGSGEDYVESNFKEALTASVAFMMLTRCGYNADDYLDIEAFRMLFEYNTTETVSVFGTATADISQMALREIERTVRSEQKKEIRTFANPEHNTHNEITEKPTTERSAEYGTYLHHAGGLSDARRERRARRIGGDRQVRETEEIVSEGAQEIDLSSPHNQGDAQSPPRGDRPDGENESGADNERDGEIRGRERGAESERPDEMGRADEQPQEHSGGDSADGANLQLNHQAQITLTEEAEQKESSAFSLPQKAVDYILRHGSGVEDGKFRIYEQYQKSLSTQDNIAFLKKEYGTGGRSDAIPGSGLWESHDGKGISISRGHKGNPDHKDVLLKWNYVAKRIGELISQDDYLTPEEAAHYPEYLREREETARAREVMSRPPQEDVPAPSQNDEPIGAISSDADLAVRVVAFYKGYDFYGLVNALEVGDDDEAMIAQMRLQLDDHSYRSMLLDSLMSISASYAEQDFYIEELANLIDDLDSFDKQHTAFELKLGDTVHIGTDEFEIVALGDETVELRDMNYPLYFSEMPREEFDRKLRDNPLNDHLLQVADEQPQEPAELPAEKESGVNPLWDEYNRIKAEHPDRIVLIQVGDFFEVLGDDAVAVARALEITAIRRDIGAGESVPMCGVPYHRLSTYVDMLLDRGYDVAVAELSGGERSIELLSSTHKDAPIESVPVGRIEFLGTDGAVGDVIEYIDEAEFIRDIFEENHYGTPMSIKVYRHDDGSTIPTDFAANLDPPPQGFEVIDAPDRTQTPYMPLEAPQTERRDFRITDDALGEGGAKQKFAWNIEAITLLKRLEAENRLAAPDEQEILSRYVGWGGISKAFDGDDEQWTNEYTQLKELLTDEEYASARATVLNAHYTSPVVIKAMYEALGNMGFSKGNILEPSCGIGNFFGLLPDSMSESRLYGVEIDGITGRIAKQLYQRGDIRIQGYETTDFPDSFFDVAIGNVPFGDYGVNDPRYNKYGLHIHDYFFAKTLDKVRPGGIVAFVTSKGTLDKQNPNVRKYIAQRADLIGAIRLPNNAFLKNAGTGVTADIIFLQKRESLSNDEPSWVHIGRDENDLPLNQYFIENPDMILGVMTDENTQYGKDTVCKPIEGAVLSEQLREAVANIRAEITEYDAPELEDGEEDNSIPADPLVRNFSYTLVDDKLYFRQNSVMLPIEVSVTAENRIKGMIEIRDCVRTLIEYQSENYSDHDIEREQQRLNTLYDRFTKKYGVISSRANSSAFSDDNSYALLCSLEVFDANGEFERKAEMFTKRTIRRKSDVQAVDTASEALALSLSEKAHVNLEYMSQLTGKSEEELCEELKGIIFFNIDAAETQDKTYVTADEYLSGNVKEKLKLARAAAQERGDNSLDSNIAALEAVQPVDLTAAEVSVRLGSTWVPTEVVQDFVFDLLQTPSYSRWNIKVHHSAYTATWNVEGKSFDRSNIAATTTYGTGRVNAYKLIEDCLNLKDTKIYDRVTDERGNEVSVLNRKETAIAQQKQDAIKQAFQDWIWADPERRDKLLSLYNEKFNSTRPREFDGSHLTFPGMNPEIQLKPHQVNAVARMLYGGNTLLGHVVGAGKTFEMAAAAMEQRRLGLCQKPLFVVPNHLTEQWAAEFLQLYPAANILVATKKDFETKRRKKFCGRIATGDYDAVIIGHSQFEKIPMSLERQRRILEEQIVEITAGIVEAKQQRGERFTVKQLEKSKKSLRLKLEKLNDQSRKDDVVTFEELGVDRLFIDEAHFYKNLYIVTKMSNVAGISTTEAQKSSDLFMKCRYMDELTGSKGVVFATGTPVSNSMTELYTMQRYLQYETLRAKGLEHFDAWASTFGETVTAIELKPEGTGYRSKTRFAKFFNLPELMSMFKEVADIQTADMLDLPVPKANYITVATKPSEFQKEMLGELSERADAVRAKLVEPTEDNMLKITNDGRKLALDQRLINPMLPDEETSKVNACVDRVYRTWERHKDARLTQLIFCDLSTPKGDGTFNVYDDIRSKLIAKGVPENEIAFIHNAKSDMAKKEVFAKVRSGQIRVLIGSTQKMGAGTNVQDKLLELHDLDCPWRPSDLEQRAGRIVRQGNKNPEVTICRYVTENTFDAYLYQIVENKQRFIGQIMTSKSPARSAEDVDETALSYAEIKMLATGNPYIKEKMDLDVQVAKLKMLKATYLSQKYALEDWTLKKYPAEKHLYEERIKGYEADIALYEKNKTVEVLQGEDEPKFLGMTVNGQFYDDKGEAGKAIIEFCASMKQPEATPLGSYLGFDMTVAFDSFGREYKLTLKSSLGHTISLGADAHGNITRINNALERMGENLALAREKLTAVETQKKSAEQQIAQPFSKEDELKEKSARLATLDAMLNLDAAPERESVDAEQEPEDTDDLPKAVGYER